MAGALDRDALFDKNCHLKDDNNVLRGAHETLLAQGRACRDVAEEENRKRVEAEKWSRELEVACTLADAKLLAQREDFKEHKANFALRLENAKAVAAEEIAQLKKHYTLQLQGMYTGAVEKTLFILEHDHGVDIKGLTAARFPLGVKHPGYLQYL